MKKWYQSRTIQIAILTGVLGVITAFESQFPEIKTIGIIVSTKAIIDIILRLDTKLPIE